MTATTLSRGMMPLLGRDQTCWSFGGFGDKEGQVSNLVCIAGISTDGKTITIAPFGENCLDLIRKAQGIVQNKLLATVQGTSGKVRLVASETMISKISQKDVKAKKVKLMVQGEKKAIAKVVIADAVNDRDLEVLTREFKAFGLDVMTKAAAAKGK